MTTTENVLPDPATMNLTYDEAIDWAARHDIPIGASTGVYGWAARCDAAKIDGR